MKIKSSSFIRYLLTGLVILSGIVIADFAVAQQMGWETPPAQQIVCGKQLCTVGDPGNGGHQRVCWEITRKKGKCKYVCQGNNDPSPEDCKKKACRTVYESTAGCVRVNNGKPMPPNYEDRPDEYKRYYEAPYTDNEKSEIPLCPNNGGVSQVTCKCGTGSGQIVCQANKICVKESYTQTDMGQGYSHTERYLCKEAENTQNADGSTLSGGTGTTFSDYGGMTSVEYTNSQVCPTYADYVAKYNVGCWSCLVMEKITSSFLRVASKGLKVCQEAGHILLWLGFAIWLVFWGLKNVSSFTEIKGANILNDLLKMGAKVVIAYYCIVAGPAAIREFIVTPIMGIGATIAQNFWYGKEDAQNSGVNAKYLQGIETQDFDWELDPFEDHSDEFDENEVTATTTEVVSEEEQEQRQEVIDMDEQIGAEVEIPPFQVPGTNGSLTSFPGCRIPPPTPKSCGSYAHMGLDVGASHHSPIWAMAGGTVTYSKMSGYGNVVVIRTEHKGNLWEHMYAHMDYNDWSKYSSINGGRKVARGTIIGGVGCTSSGGPGEVQEGRECAYAQHLHVEVMLTGTIGGKQYKSAILDPVSLADGKIVVRGHKEGGIQSSTVRADCDCRIKGGCQKHANWKNHKPAFEDVHPKKKWCLGFNLQDPDTSINRGQRFPNGGITSPDVAKVETSEMLGGSVGSNYGSLNVTIPEVKYTGPTDIMPKSIMNSILGAVKAITFNTSQFQILGNVAMCFAWGDGGTSPGAYKIDLAFVTFRFPNISMWLCGVVLWFLGFMLTCAVAFYVLDISFKIGFAVMALPIVMGLWPFKVTQSKLAEVISIIAKASCDFAFLALTTYFGINLVAAVYGDGGIEQLFQDYDSVITQTAGSDTDAIVEKLKDMFYLFSSIFLMMLFAIIYAYKLVSQTSKDLVEKFFPDNAFGNASPMHKGLTGAVSIANNLNKKYGLGLAADIAANKAGQGIRKLGGKVTGAMGAAPKAAFNAVRRGINKFRGGKK